MEPAAGSGAMMDRGMQQGHDMMGGGMGMMADCPCMQMHQMMTGSPMGWVMMIGTSLLVLAAIAALVSLSVFLIRRSRQAVVA